ncbi:MAG: site-specific integrase [Bacteroides sp.]|jgi:integrase|nr:site-specific integrase [Bacteroides sp.]
MRWFKERSDKQANALTSLKTFTDSLIGDLIGSGHHGAAHSYSCSLRRLLRFSGRDDLRFSELTPLMLKDFEQYLYGQNCRRNTVSLYMRMLRALCNRASASGIPDIPPGLFKSVFTGSAPAAKRAVSPSVIRRLRELSLPEDSPLALPRDLFLLSFYLRGIPFVDLIHIRRSDIVGKTLRYRRSKTGRFLSVPLEPCALAILQKYASLKNDSPYLLSFVSKKGVAGYRQYQSALRLYNLHLQKLSALLGLKVRLTSYVARHSWATAAYHQGIPVSLISESLGHASEKMTYAYLSCFNTGRLKLANRKVIRLILNPYDPLAVRRKEKTLALKI